MPRFPVVVGMLAIAVASLAWNMTRFPAVWEMVGPAPHSAAASTSSASMPPVAESALPAGPRQEQVAASSDEPACSPMNAGPESVPTAELSCRPTAAEARACEPGYCTIELSPGDSPSGEGLEDSRCPERIVSTGAHAIEPAAQEPDAVWEHAPDAMQPAEPAAHTMAQSSTAQPTGNNEESSTAVALSSTSSARRCRSLDPEHVCSESRQRVRNSSRPAIKCNPGSPKPAPSIRPGD